MHREITAKNKILEPKPKKSIIKLFRFIAAATVIALISCSPKPILKTSSAAQETKGKKKFVPFFIVPSTTAEYYETSFKKLQSKVPDSIIAVDLIKFRYSYLAYMEKAHAYVSLDLEKDFNNAINSGDYKNVETLADKILQNDFTDIRVHMMKAISQKKNGEDFTFHKTMVDRLKASILSSGNGRTPETAFHVAQVKEEYAILNSFGLRMKMQSLTDVGNHSFDVMDCEDKDGKAFTVYFDITEHMNSLARELK